MKRNRIWIATASALALYGALPAAAQTTTWEAEGMSLSSYGVESGSRIKLSSRTSTGTASKTFSGTEGVYNIQVYVIPENDGQSTLQVYNGTTLLRSYTYPVSTTATSFTISNVALKSGDSIRLVGKSASGDTYARVDKVVLTLVSATTGGTTTGGTTTGGTTTGGSTPIGDSLNTIPRTIEAEAMTLSSYAIENGNRIKLTAATGTAKTKFPGGPGNYKLQVYAITETDGQPQLDVLRNGAKLKTFTYPSGSSTVALTIDSVALATGDEITLVGRANATAYARVDKIVLTPTTTAPGTGADYQGTPFSGTPIALPKAFPASDFDRGGDNVAYRDLTSGNSGNVYRTDESVDIRASADTASNGYEVFDFQAGEWLGYTVNAAASGAYDLSIRASNSQSAAASFHIEVDGSNVSGTLSVPPGSGYQWIGKQGVNLAAGKRIVKIVSEAQRFNMSALSALPASTTQASVSFKTPAPNQQLSGNISQSSACELVGANIKGVQFAMGSTALNNETGAPWNCNVDTTKFADGPNTLKATATLTDGRTALAEVPVTIKNGTTSGGGSGGTPLPDPVTNTPPTGATFFCSFENSPSECGFREQAAVAGRATLVNISRAGSKAVRLNTQPGDAGVSGSNAWERNDLTLDQATTGCYAGAEQWWAHSIYFPSDFVNPTEGGVVADFHHTGSTGQANYQIFTRPEGLVMWGAGGPTVATGYSFAGAYKAALGPVVKNQWYDFVYHVKWSPNSDGFFYGWVNGALKITYRGPTLYSGQGCYLKLANYHNATGQASSVIHDRVVRGNSAEAVSLTPLQPVP